MQIHLYFYPQGFVGARQLKVALFPTRSALYGIHSIRFRIQRPKVTLNLYPGTLLGKHENWFGKPINFWIRQTIMRISIAWGLFKTNWSFLYRTAKRFQLFVYCSFSVCGVQIHKRHWLNWLNQFKCHYSRTTILKLVFLKFVELSLNLLS